MKNQECRTLLLEKTADKIALLLLGAHMFFFCGVAILRYQYFDFTDFDLAVYLQTLWNMAHGSITSSILGVPFLANHTEFILFPLLPLSLALGIPTLLFVSQALAVSAGGFLFYRFASRENGKPWALLLLVMYLAYPPLSHALFFEFHPDALAVPFLFLVFFAYRRRDLAAFLLYATIAMLCKENIPLIIAMFSVLAILDKRKARWILVPGLWGMLLFLVLIFFVKPHFDNHTIDFFLRYQQFGRTPGEIFSNIILSPRKTALAIFSAENFRFFFGLVSSAAFLPIFAIKALVPCTPAFLQHFFWQEPNGKSLLFHYSLKFLPFIFISSSDGLRRLLSLPFFQKQKKGASFLLFAFAFLCCLWANILIGNPYSQIVRRVRWLLGESKNSSIYQKYIAMIPDRASVVATFKFLPKLSYRKELYSFHHFYMGTYTLSLKPYPLPANLDYALIDFNDDFAFSFQRPESPLLLKKFFDAYGWQAVDQDGSTVLFSPPTKDTRALFQVLANEPKAENIVRGNVNNDIELIGFSQKLGAGQKAGEVFFTFYWRCLKEHSTAYETILTVVDRRGTLIAAEKKNMCYRLYPTSEWKEGDIIQENYWYVLPESASLDKRYCLKLVVIDENTRKAAPMISEVPAALDVQGAAILLYF